MSKPEKKGSAASASIKQSSASTSNQKIPATSALNPKSDSHAESTGFLGKFKAAFSSSGTSQDKDEAKNKTITDKSKVANKTVTDHKPGTGLPAVPLVKKDSKSSAGNKSPAAKSKTSTTK